VPAVPGCHTQGATIDETRQRIREALALFVEDAADATFTEGSADPQYGLPDDENPEWTEEEILTAKTFAEVFPELARSIKRDPDVDT
jgi:hypothetical protein